MNEQQAMQVLEKARADLLAKVNEYIDEASDCWDDAIEYTPPTIEDDFILYLQASRE